MLENATCLNNLAGGVFLTDSNNSMLSYRFITVVLIVMNGVIEKPPHVVSCVSFMQATPYSSSSPG